MMSRRRHAFYIAGLWCVVTMPEAYTHAGATSATAPAALTWNPDPWMLVPMIVSVSLYGVGWRRLSRKARHGISAWHAVAFLGGCVALALALLSPLDALGGQLFSAHMVQHEVLMLIAAPLLVLGKPLAVFAWGMPAPWAQALAQPFRAVLWQRFWRSLTAPLSAWSLHALALWVWHAPALFQASLRSDSVHSLQHTSFLISALLFWWAMLRRRARVDPVFYVFTTLLHTGVLGMLLTFAPSLWYPFYIDTTSRWGLTPLEDQQLGGLVMWVPAGAILMAAGLALFGHWLGRLGRSAPAPLPGDGPGS